MFLRSIALLTLETLAACSPDSPGRRAAANLVAAGATPDTVALRQAAQKFRVHYNSPADLDSTGFYYVPVLVVAQEQASRSKMFSSGSYEGYGEQSGSIEGTCYDVLSSTKKPASNGPCCPTGASY